MVDVNMIDKLNLRIMVLMVYELILMLKIYLYYC